MARIQGIKREKAGLITRILYWAVYRRLGRVSEMWQITAHSPKLILARGIFELLLDRSYLVDRRIRKLAEIKASMLIGCPAWLDSGSAEGRAAGVTEEELKNLTRYRESNVFGEIEKLVLDLAVAMTRTPTNISDEDFKELQKHFTSPQLVELSTAIAQANFRGRINRVFRCEPAGFSEGVYCPMPER